MVMELLTKILFNRHDMIPSGVGRLVISSSNIFVYSFHIDCECWRYCVASRGQKEVNFSKSPCMQWLDTVSKHREMLMFSSGFYGCEELLFTSILGRFEIGSRILLSTVRWIADQGVELVLPKTQVSRYNSLL